MSARAQLCVAALCVVLGATGCPSSQPGASSVPSPATPATGDRSPHRIVAFTCGAVDILTSLGARDRIIAVEEDCPLPGMEDKIKIRNDDHPGQVKIVQAEAIMALHPDLVIAKLELKDALENRGLNVLWSPTNVTLTSLPGFVMDIATAVGIPEKGRALVDQFQGKEKELRARTASLPKVRVYYEINGAGRTQGTSTIPDAMIRLAGGASLAGDDARPVVNMSPEAVVAANPEVIILGPFAASAEEVCARPGWDQTDAVKNKRVHKVGLLERYVGLGTPRCVNGCEELFLPWIHPELAKPAPGTAK